MSLTILYVDDEPDMLNLFKVMFVADYNIRIFDNPADALRTLADCPANSPVDIIISDQMMPQMNGTEFLRLTASLCPESFRIMLTGNAVVGDVFGQIASGVINIFISKPWNASQMRGFLMLAENTLARRFNTMRIA